MYRGFRSFFHTAIVMGVSASKEGKGKAFGGIAPALAPESIMSKKGFRGYV